MESQLVGWVVSLITGGVGGNIAGALFKNLSLGTVGNSIAGVVGGGLGGQLLTAALGSGGAPGILGNVAGSGVGGIVVMVLVGLIKNAVAKK